MLHTFVTWNTAIMFTEPRLTQLSDPYDVCHLPASAWACI